MHTHHPVDGENSKQMIYLMIYRMYQMIKSNAPNDLSNVPNDLSNVCIPNPPSSE